MANTNTTKNLTVKRQYASYKLSNFTDNNQDIGGCGAFNSEIKQNPGFWISISDIILVTGAILLTALITKLSATVSDLPANPPQKPHSQLEEIDHKDVQIEMKENNENAKIEYETVPTHARVNSETNFNQSPRMSKEVDFVKDRNYFEDLPLEESIAADNRHAFKYFLDKLLISNFALGVCYRKSPAEPISIRIIYLSLYVVLLFGFNAFFYNDALISQRAGANNQSFGFTWTNEFWKCIISVFLTYTIVNIFKYCFDLSKTEQKELTATMAGLSQGKKKEEYEKFLKKHMARFITFFTLMFVLHILAWYYIVNFCGVYILTSVAWVYGGIVSFIMMSIFSVTVIPATSTLIRKVAQTYPKTMCVLKYL